MFKVVLIPGKGRGLVATRPIRKGTRVEKSPLLVFNKADSAILDKTLLRSYVFDYGYKKTLLCLGYGSLFNNDDSPNVEAVMHEPTYLCFYALRNIKKGEELVINYGPEWNL